jgi:hypothetical protein
LEILFCGRYLSVLALVLTRGDCTQFFNKINCLLHQIKFIHLSMPNSTMAIAV